MFRYDSSYMDEILMMTGFESIKVPGAQFGRNTFALKSRKIILSKDINAFYDGMRKNH